MICKKVPTSPKITSLKKLNKQWTSKNKQKTHLGFFGIQKILYFKCSTPSKVAHTGIVMTELYPLFMRSSSFRGARLHFFSQRLYHLGGKKAAKSNMFVVTFLNQALLKANKMRKSSKQILSQVTSDRNRVYIIVRQRINLEKENIPTATETKVIVSPIISGLYVCRKREGYHL